MHFAKLKKPELKGCVLCGSVLGRHYFWNTVGPENRSVFAKVAGCVDSKEAAGGKCLSERNVLFVTLVVESQLAVHLLKLIDLLCLTPPQNVEGTQDEV